MFWMIRSLRGNGCAQVFTNGMGYNLFYLLKKKSEASEALNEVIQMVGVPKELVSDGAKAQTQGEFARVCKEYCVKQRTMESHSQWVAEPC
jgi:hypothetical protein